MYQSDDLVCEVLTRHPAAWNVFVRHGMCEDCKQSPPPVPISHFATKHCDGRIEDFLNELNGELGLINQAVTS